MARSPKKSANLEGPQSRPMVDPKANQQPPFLLRIFVADGDPDGLRLVERSNWNGNAVIFPRALYPQVRNRPEFQQTGVYLLLGPRPDGDGEMLYIGKGDPVRPRLESHYAQKRFMDTCSILRGWSRSVEQSACSIFGSSLINPATQ